MFIDQNYKNYSTMNAVCKLISAVNQRQIKKLINQLYIMCETCKTEVMKAMF